MASNPQAQGGVPLTIVGFDFRVAGARWRSRLVSKLDDDDALGRQLMNAGLAQGLAVLQTCNRNEWIASAERPEWCGEILRAQLIRRLREKSPETNVPAPYVLCGEEAARHVLRMSAGLESFVVGERQIAGQLSCALGVALKQQRSDAILKGLASFAGRAAREAARFPVGEPGLRGVHDLAIRYLTQRHDPQSPWQVLVLGYGDIGRRVVDGLRARTVWQVKVVNRSLRPNAKEELRPLAALPELLAESDALIIASGAASPLFGREHILPRSPARPLVVIDIGIPIQSTPETAQVPEVLRLDLDGLQGAVTGGERDTPAFRALDAALGELLAEFVRFCREREVVTILRTTQSMHEEMVRERIPQAIAEELPELSLEQRERLAFRLRGLLRDYTNAVIDSIHQTAETK